MNKQMPDNYIQPARIFQEGMLLQRDKPVTVWGTGTPDLELEAEIQGQHVRGKVRADGTWSVTFAPLHASEDETLRIRWKDGELTYANTAVGELWLAGGQSNMEFQLCFEKHYREEELLPDNRMIRFYDVPEVAYPGQEEDFDYHLEGIWRSANPEERKYFSAAGYYFAKELQDKLQIPAGIIGCNWGGTCSCAWMRKDSVRKLDNYWWKKYQHTELINRELYYQEQKENPANNRGNLIEDPFTAAILTRTILPDEAEEFMKDFPTPDMGAVMPPEIPGALFENMVEPLGQMAIRGVLWYQGESDDEAPSGTYREMLRTLISDWRGLWHEKLPFLVVQLPGYERWLLFENIDFISVRAEQQEVADSDDQVFLCSISDIGERFDIHPREKRLVGQRLARLARGHIYGEDILCDPPVLKSAEQQGDSYLLTFDHADGGLVLKGEQVSSLQCLQQGQSVPYSFELTGNQLVLHPESACDRITLGIDKWFAINLYNQAGIPAVPFDICVPKKTVQEKGADIYISSSNVDRDVVNNVIEALENGGFSCCLPGRDFGFDTDWEQKAANEINESTLVLCFHSDASRRSFRLHLQQKLIDKSGLMKLDLEVSEADPESILEMVRKNYPEAVKIKKQLSLLIPYIGSQPYIFASYSHRDKDRVFKIIRRLQEHGYRVWFDEGIDPGTEWDENIAEHLINASYLIPFFSENFFGSDNCNDELYFARENGIGILPVYLEEVNLESGIEMRYGRLQSLFCYKIRKTEDFLNKVDEAEDIDQCRDKERDQ